MMSKKTGKRRMWLGRLGSGVNHALRKTQGRTYCDVLRGAPVAFWGYQFKAGQFEVKPFVVSLSNHERLNRPPFDKLRANG
jgi:hypothetical protein